MPNSDKYNYNLDLRICNFYGKNNKIIYNNPHCLEFFCYLNNVFNCTNCLDFLTKKNNIKLLYRKLYNNPNKKYKSNIKYCKKFCNCGYVYDGYTQFDTVDNKDLLKESNVDKYKLTDTYANSISVNKVP
jgi:hypothetical protein